MTGRAQFAGGILAILACGADQASKAIALSHAEELNPPVALLPFLNLVLWHNTGISFGLLGTVPLWALLILSGAIISGLGLWLLRTVSRVTASALGLVIGGATGNVIDRLRHGAVTDFIDLHLGGYHWPAFNLADAAIFVGAAVLIVQSFVAMPKAAPE